VAEVIRRRFRDAREHGGLPDLLVIDGGLGQLGAARAVLEELGIADLEVVGLAKERSSATRRHATSSGAPSACSCRGGRIGRVEANSTALFSPAGAGRGAPLRQYVHQKLRDRARLASPLDDIPASGPPTAALLRRFGSLRRVAAASAEELATVPASR